MEAIFQSALWKLPAGVVDALESSGLDDASTLANYPRLTLVELQSRGFCVAPVTETADTAGTTMVDTDVVTCGTHSGIALSTLSFCYRLSSLFFSLLRAPVCLAACLFSFRSSSVSRLGQCCSTFHAHERNVQFMNRCDEVWQASESETHEDSAEGGNGESSRHGGVIGAS